MRWKFVVPLLAIIVIITLFNILFLDSFVRKGIILGGEMAFGAKVEVKDVKTRITNLSIDVKSIKVANKNDPWKNLFEIGDMRFSLKFVPLLSRKLIIDEMAVEGIKLGTTRKTSGALSPKKLAKIEEKKKEQAVTTEQQEEDSFSSKMMGKINEKATTEIKTLPALDKIKNAEKEIKNMSADKLVSASDLESLKEMDSIKNDINEKYSKYGKELSQLNIDQKLKDASNMLTDVKSTKIGSVDDFKNAKNKLENLDSAKIELEKELDNLKTLKSQMQKDLDVSKEITAKLKDFKEKDFQNISRKLKLPEVSFQNIAEPLFGPIWLNRVNSVMHYLVLARKYMPPKKKDGDKKVVKKSRMGGIDVSFPKEDNPPDFLISKVLLTGETNPENADKSIIFDGNVTDITSDPGLLGRPTKIALEGTKMSKRLDVSGTLDHVNEVPVDSISIVYRGLTVQELGIPTSDYLPSMEKSNAKIDSTFTLRGDEIDCIFDLNISDIKLSGEVKDELVKELWEGITNISVQAKLYGTTNGLNMVISSNLDNILSKRLKELVGKKLSDLQNRIRAEIDNLTNAKKNELMNEANSKKQELQGKFTSKQNELQGKIDSIKSEADKKENEMRDKVEAEKKRVQEDLEKKKRETEAQVNKMKEEEQRKLEEQKNKEEEKQKKQVEDKIQNLFK
ncbi:MAG: TIGR03545 family protein [Endomicrobiales bacterium]|nr:TIGR03545 family protein [Endomicrobiales bacterium]